MFTDLKVDAVIVAVFHFSFNGDVHAILHPQPFSFFIPHCLNSIKVIMAPKLRRELHMKALSLSAFLNSDSVL